MYENLLETVQCRYGALTFFKADQLIGRSLKEYGEWAQAEIDFLDDLIYPGATVADIGAFIGTHTLAFARIVGPEGKVYAFEPIPPSFELLERNVAQNHLSNVIAMNIALSDVTGTVHIPEIRPQELENPGKFSISHGEVSTSEQSSSIDIQLKALDDLDLSACDIVKIDVEGMELEVLAGAIETLKRHQPIVFAECLSVGSGWKLVQFMKGAGFEPLLHNEASYNPQNHRGNPDNFLESARETNLLFIHEDKESWFQARSRHTQNLIPVETIDDLVLGLLKKPQYKQEVLANTAAARKIGHGFWANEPELSNLRKENEQAIHTLTQQVAEKELGIESLRNRTKLLTEEVAEKQQANVKLQGQVNEKNEAIQALAMEVATRERVTESLEQRIEQLSEELAASELEVQELIAQLDVNVQEVQNLTGQAAKLNDDLQSIYQSKSWRFTEPLRRLMGFLRLVSRVATPSTRRRGRDLNVDVMSIDSLRVRGRRIYGWGWAFNDDPAISEATLEAVTTGGTCILDCDYGRFRKDVKEAYPEMSTMWQSGFLIAGQIPAGRLRKLSISFALRGGSVESIDVSDYVPRRSFSISSQFIARIIKRASNAIRYALHGDFEAIIQYVKTNLRGSARPKEHRFTSLAAANLPQPDVLVIDHSLGGGANTYRETLISEFIEQGKIPWLLVYDLPTMNFRLEIHERERQYSYELPAPTKLSDYIDRSILGEIVVNDLYSYDDPLAMLHLITGMKESLQSELTILVHDYFSVCPSFVLLNELGSFCGVPDDLSRCRRCMARNTGDWLNLVDYRDIQQWRDEWGHFLEMATRIVCFSVSSKRLLLKAYPHVDRDKIRVHPHQVDTFHGRYVEVKLDEDLHIGIVGNISEYKGASIVRELCNLIDAKRLDINVTIFGTMEKPPKSSRFQLIGQYERQQLPDLIEEFGANIFFLPSIIPETFSYVTDELIQLGVPIAVFDIGAPPERVRQYKNGFVISEISAKTALEEIVEWHNLQSRERLAEGSSIESE